MEFLYNLTLLLPVYNGGEKFKRLLESLDSLNSKTNLIIYNDGSADESYQVGCNFAEFTKHKVRVIDGKKNRGYFRTIKILLKICPTDFFIFLGHDDQLSNNFLDEFYVVTSGQQDIACIFTDIATITPKGVTTNTWPNTSGKNATPKKISCLEAAKTFHQRQWGNLFVAIWSRRVLSQKTLVQIMRCIPNSDLTSPLKRSGFLNDHMAVLRTLSSNSAHSIYYNNTGIYFKEMDPDRVSEGKAQFKIDNILHSPLGYLSIVAHFMLPQIQQKCIATLWLLRYLYIYLGIAIKSLFCRPKSFDINTFFQGIHLILTGFAAGISVGRMDQKAERGRHL